MKNIAFIIFAVLFSVVAIGAELNGGLTDRPVSNSTISASSEDKLIEQLLTVSGMKISLQRMSEQRVSGAKHAAAGNGAAADVRNAMVKIMTEAYPKDGFVNRVRDALKKNYNEKRYLHLLQLLSTPLSKRMTDLEAIEPSPVNIRKFASQISVGDK